MSEKHLYINKSGFFGLQLRQISKLVISKQPKRHNPSFERSGCTWENNPVIRGVVSYYIL